MVWQHREGVADGRRGAYLELLEQISGSERIHLGSILRRGIQEALGDVAATTESFWNDNQVQFDRVGTGLGPGIWEVRSHPLQ